MKKCVLEEKYNQCPELGENQECLRDGHCNMQEPEEPAKTVYQREQRWYKKYYNWKVQKGNFSRKFYTGCKSIDKEGEEYETDY